MTAEEAKQLMSEGKAVLVDCRERQELAGTGTAEGALWMPFSGMMEETPEWSAFWKGLPRDKQIILYCKLGGRSHRMADFLSGEGFNAVNLGGFALWTVAGLPVIPFKG